MPLPTSDRINELLDQLREQCRFHREQISALEDRISQIDTELHLQRHLNETLLTPGEILSQVGATSLANDRPWDERRVRFGYASAADNHLRIIHSAAAAFEEATSPTLPVQAKSSRLGAGSVNVSSLTAPYERPPFEKSPFERSDMAVVRESEPNNMVRKFGQTPVESEPFGEPQLVQTSTISDLGPRPNIHTESIGTAATLIGAKVTPLSAPIMVRKAPVPQKVLRLPFLNQNPDPSISQIANAISAAASTADSTTAQTYAPRQSSEFPSFLPNVEHSKSEVPHDTPVDITARLNKEDLRRGHRAIAVAQRFGRWKRIFVDGDKS